MKEIREIDVSTLDGFFNVESSKPYNMLEPNPELVDIYPDSYLLFKYIDEEKDVAILVAGCKRYKNKEGDDNELYLGLILYTGKMYKDSITEIRTTRPDYDGFCLI